MVVGEGEWKKVKVNCDAVDGRFKLRYPSKITFNIHARKSDSRIKYCINF